MTSLPGFTPTHEAPDHAGADKRYRHSKEDERLDDALHDPPDTVDQDRDQQPQQHREQRHQHHPEQGVAEHQQHVRVGDDESVVRKAHEHA